MFGILDISAAILFLFVAAAAFFPATTATQDLIYRAGVALAAGGFTFALASRIGSGSLWVRALASLAMWVIVLAANPLGYFSHYTAGPGKAADVVLSVGDQPSPQALAVLRAARDELIRKGDHAGAGALSEEIGRRERRSGDYAAAVETFDAAEDSYRKAGDPGNALRMRVEKAETDMRRGDLASARSTYESVRSAIDVLRETLWKDDVGVGLAEASLEAWDEGAREELATALEASRAAENRVAEARAVMGLGELDRREGQLEQARARFNHTLALARKLGADELAQRCLLRLVALEIDAGNLDAAKRYADEALAMAKKLEDPRGEADALVMKGRLALVLEDPTTARERYMEALVLYRRIGADRPAGDVQFSIAQLETDPEEASRAFVRAAHLWGVPRSPQGRRLADAAAGALLGSAR
jgi:tetratricopeptide (TPR) repeat protein